MDFIVLLIRKIVHLGCQDPFCPARLVKRSYAVNYFHDTLFVQRLRPVMIVNRPGINLSSNAYIRIHIIAVIIGHIQNIAVSVMYESGMNEKGILLIAVGPIL